jgi:hypothetical protein
MASLVESGLSNLNYGDADSVGFFQMRVGIWNQGDYAGYPDRPELQLGWFLDQAEAVKAQRVARGLPIDDPNAYGEWIADIEPASGASSLGSSDCESPTPLPRLRARRRAIARTRARLGHAQRRAVIANGRLIPRACRLSARRC